jgi:serine/threonine protein phosphatase PrpC
MSATCPACGEPVEADAAFCESCGAALPGAPEGATRDHQEADLGALAAVSDRGLRHHRNEDAFGIAGSSDRFAVVVCDGVSSTPNPDDASAAAAAAALAELQPILEDAWPDDDDLTAIMSRAVEAAGAAAAAVVTTEMGSLSARGQASNPSTTLVAAMGGAGHLVLGSIGDSRAYWLTGDPARSRRLTVDDSWAEQAIAAGVPPEEAYASPGAHVITRWLGADAESFTPNLVVTALDGPGWLLVCSDGLWNYFEEPATLDQLLASAPPEATPIEAARHLVNAALAAGGSDNVTVVMISTKTVQVGR